MTKYSRHHHFLPQAYLGGFTDTGNKCGQLFVFKVDNGQSFRTTPRNVGGQRDFNRVEIDGTAPDVIENAWAPFEASVADILRWIATNDAIPSGEDFDVLINFLALLAVRNPQLRKSFNRARESGLRIAADLLVSDKRIFEYHAHKARNAGEHIPENVKYEDVRNFVEKGDYSIEFGNETNIRVEINAIDGVLPCLTARHWTLLVAERDEGEFVSSDRPVTVVWKEPGMRSPVGVGMKRTELILPLNRRQALLGVYEDPFGPILFIPNAAIAEINSRTISNAERHIYAGTDSYIVVTQRGVIERISVARS